MELLLELRDSVHAWFVAVYMPARLTTLWVFHLRFSFSWPLGSRAPMSVQSIPFHTHVESCVFISGPVVQHNHNAILECAFLSSMVFISNLLFQFTHFENVPWLMLGGGGLFCLFVYQGMKYSYCTLSRAEVIQIQCKWYLGLDFRSRLLLLRGKSRLLWAVIFLGGNLFLFHAARVLDQALNALKQKCFGPQPFTPSALLYVIE